MDIREYVNVSQSIINCDKEHQDKYIAQFMEMITKDLTVNEHLTLLVDLIMSLEERDHNMYDLFVSTLNINFMEMHGVIDGKQGDNLILQLTQAHAIKPMIKKNADAVE